MLTDKKMEQIKQNYLGKCVKITVTKSVNSLLRQERSFRVEDIKLETDPNFGIAILNFLTKEIIYDSDNMYSISPKLEIGWSFNIRRKFPESKYIQIQIITDQYFNKALSDSKIYVRNYLDILRKKYNNKVIKLNITNWQNYYVKVEDFKICNGLNCISIITSEEFEVNRGAWESIHFNTDKRFTGKLILPIKKYATPLVDIDYNFVRVISDSKYSVIKTKFLDDIVNKYHGNLNYDYKGNIISGAGSSIK